MVSSGGIHEHLADRLLSYQALAARIDDLEGRYDAQFKAVFDAIRELMKPPEPTKRPIGFQAPCKESPRGSLKVPGGMKTFLRARRDGRNS